MTSLSLSQQERHRVTASPVPDDPPPPPPPGSGPSKTQPSAEASRAASGDTPAAASGGAERERKGPLGRVLSGMATLLVATVIAGRDAVVPRKKRSARARADTAAAAASRWSEFRLPSPPAVTASAAAAPWCHDCGATKTPQWRSGPMGPRTLCNNCGVKRRAAGERWGPPRRRRGPTAVGTSTVSDHPPPPQQIPMTSASSPPHVSPAWQGPLPEGYRMARGNNAARWNSPSPATTASADSELPAPPQEISDPEYSPAPPKKNKKNAAAAGRRCVHCGSSGTPQWRGGPAGPRTLCNACGVRNRQGRLLPEYRPLVSPTFDRETHSSLYTEVLQLHRHRSNDNQHQQPPAQQPQQPVDDDSQDVDLMPRYLVASDLHVSAAAFDDGASASNATGAPGMSVTGTGQQVDEAIVWLDPFLLDGPAPPLIVDDPDWMMGVVIDRDLPGGSSPP